MSPRTKFAHAGLTPLTLFELMEEVRSRDVDWRRGHVALCRVVRFDYERASGNHLGMLTLAHAQHVEDISTIYRPQQPSFVTAISRLALTRPYTAADRDLG